MASEQFSLVLGCGGQKHNNLVLCSGTYNVIINFRGHFEPDEMAKIMDFMDFACGLFDGPMGDWNKIVNTIKILRERFKLLDDKTWEALHMWLPQHKRCGAFLRLMFNADIESTLNITQESLVEPSYLECPELPASAAKKPRKKAAKTEKKVLPPLQALKNKKI